MTLWLYVHSMLVNILSQAYLNIMFSNLADELKERQQISTDAKKKKREKQYHEKRKSDKTFIAKISKFHVKLIKTFD